MVRARYDCPDVPVGPDGVSCRVVVAAHPAGKKKRPCGICVWNRVINSILIRCARPSLLLLSRKLLCRLLLFRGTDRQWEANPGKQVANVWRYKGSLAVLPTSRAHLRPCLGRSERIIV
jgi:hypothetical protein